MADLLKKKSLIGVLGTLALASAISAQQTPASPGPSVRYGRIQYDQAVITRGREIFGPDCGFCHGPDARGTGAGPDLGRSLLILSDENGQELGQFLQTGRPDRGMPAFSNLTSQQITDIAIFLHSQVQAARNRNNAPPDILVGDSKAGEAYFDGPGKCSSCHSVSGDLKNIGSKYDPVMLQDKIVSPRSATRSRGEELSDPYPRKIKVFLLSGQTISGTLIYMGEFAVTLREVSGGRRTFKRDGESPHVEIIDPLQAHQDLLMKYTDTEIHNLTAYLVTLK
jgi:cytochrome c oxidase cbb3-type subunit III